MEKKLAKKRIIVLVFILGFIFLTLVGRLAYLQLVETQRYQGLAQANLLRIIPITAPRGEIIDRNGKLLVNNRPVYALSLSFLGVSKKEQEQAENLLALILSQDKNVGKDASLWLEEIEQKLAKQVRPFEPMQVAVDVTWDTVVQVRERQVELPGVIVEEEPVRRYPHGGLLAHVLGYVREIKQEQLEAPENENAGYQMGDLYGQDGLENTYESYLRGQKGARQVEVDASGHPVDLRGVKEPVPGSNLQLTIDLRLQQVVENALAAGIENARKMGYKKANGGAAVVLDVKTGAVLAMASYPGYDPSVFVDVLPHDEWEKLQKTNALSNRVLGVYAPASTFKMVTASAILENNVVDPDYHINDPGYFYLGRRYNDWKPGGHGQVDLRKAIMFSCNTYFFQYGLSVGHEQIARYAREYGLGEKTGIELPGESAGLVPTLEFKQKMYPKDSWDYQWRDYDTLNMSIGQGFNEYSPLQLANYVATIANNGTLYKPYLVHKIISPQGDIEKVAKPEVRRKINVAPENLKIIQEGMRMVTMPGGTAYSLFSDYPMEVAAKTGSAEVFGHDSHSQFVAYTPCKNPEIAVAVTVEYGGSGSSAAGPVVREILDAYYQITRGGDEDDEKQSKTRKNTSPVNSRPANNGPGGDIQAETSHPQNPESNENDQPPAGGPAEPSDEPQQGGTPSPGEDNNAGQHLPEQPSIPSTSPPQDVNQPLAQNNTSGEQDNAGLTTSPPDL